MKLIAYPPPHDLAAQNTPQYMFKRILLAKSKGAYKEEDKMSLFHAREYFSNAIYTLDMWKEFYLEKRDLLFGEETKADKPKASPKIIQERISKIKLESLVNLVSLNIKY
jgi:hypothetical protein